MGACQVGGGAMQFSLKEVWRVAKSHNFLALSSSEPYMREKILSVLFISVSVAVNFTGHELKMKVETKRTCAFINLHGSCSRKNSIYPNLPNPNSCSATCLTRSSQMLFPVVHMELPERYLKETQ